jgi:hypothetical protein
MFFDSVTVMASGVYAKHLLDQLQARQTKSTTSGLTFNRNCSGTWRVNRTLAGNLRDPLLSFDARGPSWLLMSR